MEVSPDDFSRDACFRCGYNLLGLTNDQACPECGLLAERSRRATGELHDADPRWLRSLSRGVGLILLSIALSALPLFVGYLPQFPYIGLAATFHLLMASLDLPAIALFIGVLLLTRREGKAAVDNSNRPLRKWLRAIALVPLACAALIHLQIVAYGLLLLEPSTVFYGTMYVGIIVTCGLPVLIFIRLRALAFRIHSNHLAEHCMIVGIGSTASLLYVICVLVVQWNSAAWFGAYWLVRSKIALALQVTIGVLSILFLLWAVYLLFRFAIALWIASRKLRRKWSRDDWSLKTPNLNDARNQH